MTPMIGFLIVIGIVVLYVIGIYNSLVKARLHTEEAFAGMDVQLKRRYDMIPNLVEIVKGYAKHEKETLTMVIEARSKAMSATTPHDKLESENMLSSTLKSLFALAESYPDLKANTTYLELQREYGVLEDAIQGARRLYNSAVKGFNERVQTFPSNIIAGMFKFEVKEFFEVESPEERKNVKIAL